MPEGLDLGATTARWDEAVARVDRWLAALPGGVSRLGTEARRLYPSRVVRDGWRVPISLQSGVRRFDILVGEAFPFEPPRLALVDRPPHLTWPHIESDGYICLLTSGELVSADDPIAVLKRLLVEAVQLIEASQAGENVDDFRAEFLSYWSADAGAPLVQSLLAPQGPSRAIVVHRLQGDYVVADDAATLIRWLDHAYPIELGKARKIDPALLVWLNQPMLPSEYPASAADVVRRVRLAGLGAHLDRLGAEQLQRIAVVFGALSQNGPALAAVVLHPVNQGQHGRGPLALSRIERGFRPGHTPPAVLVQRLLGSVRSSKAVKSRAIATL